MLRDDGYNTIAVGKWHLRPADELLAPRARSTSWPLGAGFERYYGFLGGDTNQWAPDARPRQRTRSSRRATPDEGYHLTEDLADQAIRLIARTSSRPRPDKPFFLYFAPGAAHAPHQVAAGVDRRRTAASSTTAGRR